ncbi:MAG: sigma-70 family RNA polymerase sigma factor [Ruminiclostridium sp.]|nr:sigma-70 family RNA polymerase sigma factor [Ruminiclostridium sp.]
MKDTDIIELYNKRDETAIKETETKYGRLLNKIAYEILDSSEDSEECVNTTYLKTWNAIPPTVPQSLRAFICRIVRNTALSLLQKLGKCKKEDIYYELQDVIMDDNTTEMKAEAKELTILINSFLALQKKRNRQLFVLRYYYNMSIKTLAESFQMGEQAVASQLMRMRESLRAYLIDNGISI